MRQLHEVRGDDEDQPAQQGDQQDRPRDVAPRVAGFLGQGTDRVETEERVAGDRRTAHHQRHLQVATEQRLQRP